MSYRRSIRSLGIEAPERAYYFEYEEEPPNGEQLQLDTLFSGLSAGTELTFLKNTNPFFHSRFDADRGAFICGEPALRYPVPFLGYMEVARISRSQAPDFTEGDIVATTYGHKSGHIANPDSELLVKLPDSLEPILGIFVAQMGPIAANGILHADAETAGQDIARLGQGIEGRPVIVMGAGTVGLMTALFARHCHAADIIVADPSPFRRAKAEAMGFEAMSEEQVSAHAKRSWHHGGCERGADFVFQTRAHSKSLDTALKALRPQGTVIDLAFYQNGAKALRLGEEFHHNGLNIRCAQINRVPRGLSHRWDRRRLARETIVMLQREGSLILEHMITDIIPFDDGAKFLNDLSSRRRDFIQVVFKADV
ncbi:zinc-binding alcohol dehydrogenase [Phyllobacterium sp. UNC302MFCol5.2]|uniref:zinc-dependent alcohol dehydrogenase n=1 Tax=Phyllobacterium sp. UNC302MFCol5.2 TaxID=1449065 RepID=UPI000A949631